MYLLWYVLLKLEFKKINWDIEASNIRNRRDEDFFSHHEILKLSSNWTKFIKQIAQI